MFIVYIQVAWGPGGGGKRMYKSLSLAGILALLLLALLCLASQTGNKTSESQIKQEIQRGIKYARVGNFERSQECFSKVLNGQPENAAAYNNLANTYLLTGRYASALQKYWKALQHDPVDTNIYLNLGIVYHLQMEATQDGVYIGGRKSTVTKDDWKSLSDRAFDEAFTKLKSVADACLCLGIPRVGTPEYSWIQRILFEAAQRAHKNGELIIGGGRARSEWKVPVYWKTM